MLQDLRALSAVMQAARTIAILGAKDKPGAPVDRVGRYLIQAGYTVIPVHPKRKDVWGLPTYASLADIPDHVDIVNLFRAPQYCPDHAREVLALASQPSCFWMQSGIVSLEARQLLQHTGMLVVEDRCLMVDHQQLLAGAGA
ncbi:MAG: CoA-binding protein [Desulfovibrio sp.]|nr:CoA-binding protein [Desulfovibrio sp.]